MGMKQAACGGAGRERDAQGRFTSTRAELLADDEPRVRPPRSVRAKRNEDGGQEPKIVAAIGRSPRPRGRKISEEAKERFLQMLADHCHVVRAADEAGHGTLAFYRMRRRCPVFAARWRAALGQAYEKIELMMLQRTIAGLIAAGEEIAGEDDRGVALQRYSDGQALRMLRLHRSAVRGPAEPVLIDAAGQSGDAAVRAQIEVRLETMRLRLLGEAAGESGARGGEEGAS